MHHAGPKVLDQHIRLGHKTLQNAFATLGLEVKCNRTFARVLRQERHTHQAPVQFGVSPQLAREIAAVARFDLDDRGTHLRQLITGEWAGQHIGEIEHHVPAQRGVCHLRPGVCSDGCSRGLRL